MKSVEIITPVVKESNETISSPECAPTAGLDATSVDVTELSKVTTPARKSAKVMNSSAAKSKKRLSKTDSIKSGESSTQNESKESESGEESSLIVDTSNSIVFGFFLLGLINTTSYMLMLAGAKKISDGGVALSFIAANLPGFFIKFTGPLWFDKVSYKTRMLVCGSLMCASFVLVGIAAQTKSLPLQLLGVTLTGFQYGLGETFVGLTILYNTDKCVSAFCSGTGLAGIVGYGWNIFFLQVLEMDLQGTLLVANILVAMWFYVCIVVLQVQKLSPTKVIQQVRGASIKKRRRSSPMVIIRPLTQIPMTSQEKFQTVCSLWPYMSPLFLTYACQYCMQSGMWASIGFPITDVDSRNAFYVYANWSYQLGSFMARTSGLWFSLPVNAVWALSLLQAMFAIFFELVVKTTFISDWSLLFFSWWVGMNGGLVFVNAFKLIANDLPPQKAEMSLTTAPIAKATGVITGTVMGLFVQCDAYKQYGIPGSAISC